MKLYYTIDPEETSFAAMKDLSLTKKPGLKRLYDADLKKNNEALAVFLFSDKKKAQAFRETIRTLAHEWVFGSFGDNVKEDKVEEGYLVRYVDGGFTHDEETCRTPGIHFFDMRWTR